jgi:hypothetical protein
MVLVFLQETFEVFQDHIKPAASQVTVEKEIVAAPPIHHDPAPARRVRSIATPYLKG